MVKQEKKNKDKDKGKGKRKMAAVSPEVNNDQLGENASETMSNAYDNKKNKKK